MGDGAVDEGELLEALREPLESGVISVVRANQRAEFPAAFQLVAAMNPCPCGNAGRVAPRCRCEPKQIDRYRNRISGPLLDRIDLQVVLPPVDADALVEPASAAALRDSLTTAQAVAAVGRARARQTGRQGMSNQRLGPEETLRFCTADREGMTLLRRAAQSRGYSARSQHRLLRVARSIVVKGVESPERLLDETVDQRIEQRNHCQALGNAHQPGCADGGIAQHCGQGQRQNGQSDQ